MIRTSAVETESNVYSMKIHTIKNIKKTDWLTKFTIYSII